MLRALLSLALAPILALGVSPAAAQVPHLAKRGEATQLIVDGKPFLVLGGELGNSTSSNRDYMGRHWAKLKAMHLNTVLAPISWELIEPVEGKYDWSSVDWLIADARANDMRLVLLWFGAWKNSMSTYTPAWLKRDRKRFPYAIAADGSPQEILSVFGTHTRDADARAFGALMAHLKVVDGKRGTVIMVQIENEIGFLPNAREQGPEANAAFAGFVPDELLEARRRIRWSVLDNAEERFTAWHYARFTEALAAAGKKAYPLPLFVNGAQGRPGRKPGEYPAGGPLAHLFDEWRKGAPSVDFLAPDIYFPNFAGIVDGYAKDGNPVFVPEANNAGEPRAAANALRTIGKHKAIGFSPFSIENIEAAGGKKLTGLYAMLGSMAPVILQAQSANRITGFATPVTFENVIDEAKQDATFGTYKFTATFIDPWTARDKQDPSSHGAILIWLGGEDYLIAGSGVTFTAAPADGKGKAGIDWADEGRFVDGKWVAGRRMNGDQTHQGRHLRLPPDGFSIQKVRMYRY